jgi:hypothetical protein
MADGVAKIGSDARARGAIPEVLDIQRKGTGEERKGTKETN